MQGPSVALRWLPVMDDASLPGNAPVEMGTLIGTIVTCPMHCAQFDVTTGEALAGPVPHDWGTEPAPPKIGQHLATIGALMGQIDTEALGTYETKVEAGVVWIGL